MIRATKHPKKKDDSVSTSSAISNNLHEYSYRNRDRSADADAGAGADADADAEKNNPNNPNNKNNSQRLYTIKLYSLTTILLFADQNLLAPNLSAAAAEFGFDDSEKDQKLGGDIALAFFLLGAPAAFVIGCAADTDILRRSTLFGLTVLLGESACLMTYFTSSYTGLYVTRALTGFSIGGALPLLSSVLGDWFPPESRSGVMATVGVGTGVGTALGQSIAGYMGARGYNWRLPFLVVSIPALVIGVLVICTVEDPVRGGSEAAALSASVSSTSVSFRKQSLQQKNTKSHASLDEEKNMALHLETASTKNEMEAERSSFNCHDQMESVNNHMPNFLTTQCKQCLLSLLKPSTYCGQYLNSTVELFQSKTLILALIQGAPGCIPWGIINTFLNDYLSQDCGLSIQAATTIMLFFSFGNYIGLMIGGAGGNYLYKKDSRYPSLLSGTMAIVGCFPLWLLINTTQADIHHNKSHFWIMVHACLTSWIAGVSSSVTGPIVKAMLQNVTLPHVRGQAFALANIFDDFGKGLGPVFVASLIVNLGGRQKAFNVGIGFWIFCGVFNLCMYFTIQADEERTKQKYLRQYVQ